MSPLNAPEALKPDAAAVARFRRDLAELIDVESDRVLVAVSGGPDSVALLLLAHATLGDRCHAATVDHQLRAESAAEAAWVGELCAARGIAHRTLTGSMPERVHRSGNLSQRAREFRIRLLLDHARVSGGSHVATAHHADDQLETVVMRLNRGSGLSGLSGIRRSIGQGDRIVRPLLGWRHDDLAALVRMCGIDPVADPSNVDDRYDRARLRKALAQADWLDPLSASQSARFLADAEEALAWSVEELFRRRGVAHGDTVQLDADGLPDEYLRRLVLRCLEHVDQAAAPDGPETMRLVAALKQGGSGTLANVKASSRKGYWTFRPAPPRRST